mmetsp:Transcript_8517/g.13479  ORF Transcript_8517/g.13479 Transcript_8517/m.13479 type:complete len:204 (-) Transcript_8517:921-1532(-)
MVPSVWSYQRSDLYDLPIVRCHYGMFQVWSPSGVHAAPPNDPGQDVHVIVSVQHWTGSYVLPACCPVFGRRVFGLRPLLYHQPTLQCANRKPQFLWILFHKEYLCVHFHGLYVLGCCVFDVQTQKHPTFGKRTQRSTEITERMRKLAASLSQTDVESLSNIMSYDYHYFYKLKKSIYEECKSKYFVRLLYAAGHSYYTTNCSL